MGLLFENLELKLSPKYIASAIVGIIGVLLIFDGFVSVPAGHAGVIFDQGRGILHEELGEGLHLKIPFWQKVTIMDVRTQEYTMSGVAGEGYKIGDDSISARSNDGQSVWLDATILYHIDKKDASDIKQTLGDETEYLQKVVRPKSREVLREVVAQYNALDLVSEKRLEVVEKMEESLTTDFATHKITLEEVSLRNVTFSDEFATAIEDKQVAFQKIKRAEYQKQEAEQLKEKKIVEAQADAESIRLRGDALRQNPSVIQYEFVQKLAPNVGWGILPDGVTPLVNIPGFGG